jgi:hypothetical protein
MYIIMLYIYIYHIQLLYIYIRTGPDLRRRWTAWNEVNGARKKFFKSSSKCMSWDQSHLCLQTSSNPKSILKILGEKRLWIDRIIPESLPNHLFFFRSGVVHPVSHVGFETVARGHERSPRSGVASRACWTLLAHPNPPNPKTSVT